MMRRFIYNSLSLKARPLHARPDRETQAKAEAAPLSSTEQLLEHAGHAPEPAIENGSFAAAQHDRTLTNKVVIATFNIRYAVGSFLITGSLFRRAGLGRPARRQQLVQRNIEKAAATLGGSRAMPRADIIALQEADRGTQRAGSQHVARELARALDMHYTHAAMNIPRGVPPKDKQWYLNFEEPIATDDTGDTGVAILSRQPIAASSRVELPWSECAWRPRLALAATVNTGSSRLHVFNSHIDPHATMDEQLAQHESIIERAARVDEREPTILLGDFNTLIRRTRDATRRLLESHGYTSPMPSGTGTWRAGLLRLHADWIFVRGARVARWGVARPLSVSDHWPVWVEIELPEA